MYRAVPRGILASLDMQITFGHLLFLQDLGLARKVVLRQLRCRQRERRKPRVRRTANRDRGRSVQVEIICMAIILSIQELIRHSWVTIRWDPPVAGRLVLVHHLLMLVLRLRTVLPHQEVVRRRKDQVLHTARCTIPTSLLTWHII